jgi:hypothetical protein
MFTDNILDALRKKQHTKEDAESQRVVAKMKQRKRLSSEEFLKVYDSLWQQGPTTKYQTPDGWTNPKNRI